MMMALVIQNGVIKKTMHTVSAKEIKKWQQQKYGKKAY